jgi:hypothetical protein
LTILITGIDNHIIKSPTLRTTALFPFLLLFVTLTQAQSTTPPIISSSMADTWSLPDTAAQFRPSLTPGPPRPDKYVGLFYFLTSGAHGYDTWRNTLPDEGVMEKEPGDTVSPYNVTELLAKDSLHPAYGPVRAGHHWGQPYFGYYLANDDWVIRRHAQMLSDAGVDVLIMDVTNAIIYLPQLTKLMQIFASFRKEGISTPGICFIVNTRQSNTAQRLYDNIYGKDLYRDLWFQWKGKPLLLANPDSLPAGIKDFFTVRQSWAWSKGEEWFGNGRDKWTWVDHSPQHAGWHEDSTKPEELSVSVAEHPFSNIGRSYHNGQEPAVKTPGQGLFFAEQWKRGLEVDPEFIFITGWNEWTASRFNQSSRIMFLGRRMTKGETYFVDQYNDEFSRDIEPMRGGFSDHYYYQMVEGIRQFKGIRQLASDKEEHAISIDGRFEDWQQAAAVYIDDKGDTYHRMNPGFGRITSYTNTTGRNDIVEARVARQATSLSFYARTAQPLTTSADSNWMVLYLKMAKPAANNWQGFSYRVNQYRKSAGKASLEVNTGGFTWKRIAWVPIAAEGNSLELRVPLHLLGMTASGIAFEFKWTDNIPADGDALHWLDTGDVAPNAGFKYRYSSGQ